MSAAGKLNQKQVDKLVDKAARSGVAALLEVMDKHRGSRALAGQALGRMLSSPLDQVCVCVSLTVLPARYYHAWGSVRGNQRVQRGGARAEWRWHCARRLFLPFVVSLPCWVVSLVTEMLVAPTGNVGTPSLAPPSGNHFLHLWEGACHRRSGCVTG
jgi:hypothetical protein